MAPNPTPTPVEVEEARKRLGRIAQLLPAVWTDGEGKTFSPVAALEILLAAYDARGEALEAWAWLSAHQNLSVEWHGPIYGDDDDDAEEWRVNREHGGINDREWTVVGTGATALEAVLAARSALHKDAGR